MVVEQASSSPTRTQVEVSARGPELMLNVLNNGLVVAGHDRAFEVYSLELESPPPSQAAILSTKCTLSLEPCVSDFPEYCCTSGLESPDSMEDAEDDLSAYILYDGISPANLDATSYQRGKEPHYHEDLAPEVVSAMDGEADSTVTCL